MAPDFKDPASPGKEKIVAMKHPIIFNLGKDLFKNSEFHRLWEATRQLYFYSQTSFLLENAFPFTGIHCQAWMIVLNQGKCTTSTRQEGTWKKGQKNQKKKRLPLLELMGIFQWPFFHDKQVFLLQNFLSGTWLIYVALQG